MEYEDQSYNYPGTFQKFQSALKERERERESKEQWESNWSVPKFQKSKRNNYPLNFDEFRSVENLISKAERHVPSVQYLEEF